MRTYSLKVAAVFVGLMPLLTTVHADDGIRIVYQEPLDQVRMAHGASAGQQKPGAEARSISFDAFDKRYDINLEVNRALLATTQRVQLDSRYTIYRGDIAGIPNSWVRLVIADGVPRGMLWDGTELLAIDVERDVATGREKAFIYRLSDLQIPPGTLGCSEIGPVKNAAELAKAVITEVTGVTSQGPGATSAIDLAIIGDYEFTRNQLLDAAAELTTRMNNVDGIFSMQLGVQLNVNRVDTYSINDDPFSDQTDASMLLDELTDYRFDTAAQHANGLTHLFTGRNLDTSTVGLAYTGALCSRRYGAGLTQGTHTAIMDSLIAAHEIGHNFGAPHDGQAGSACESETGDYLMAAQLNGSDEFSACSITQMRDDVSRASCVSALPSTDVAIVAASESSAVLLGDPVTVTFDANSVGTNTASGVNVDVTIPAGMNLNSVSASAGSCTSGAGSASCALGSIAGGSGVTVTIAAESTAVGSADFVASITANTDANSNNNQATVRLTVNTAVDLIATAAATTQVALDASATIRPTIENNSPIAATGVTLTVTPNAGINIDSASWAPGSCNIDNDVVTCQAGSLAAQSNNTLQLGITGTSDGSQSYSLTVSAAETDRAPSNNNASGQVNVGNAVTNPPDESGAGSIGWLSLLFLILSVMLMRAARNRDSLKLMKNLTRDC
ncbi:MAG: M12 family metallo-peptidase [Gammaproteobacteria bacterium]|nr:M12 family metallo-peptidase [Gammaproteobacteria bacterium]